MKKIISLFLCMLLILSCMGNAFAYRGEETKTYIVVLEAPAVYSSDRVMLFSGDNSDESYRNTLLELQAEVKSQINGGISLFSAEKERTYTYTDILNGFTIKTDSQTASEIENIDGVRAVYEDEIMDIVEPVASEEGETVTTTEETTDEETQISAANSGTMLNVQSAYDKGYNGEGRAVAVIDTSLIPTHEYYQLSDASAAKYTEEDIADIISQNSMNVPSTGNVYKNEKIPFAYNYASDSENTQTSNSHGVHVSGIAAGNGVSVSDGIIKGIAPEAQILFFGVYGENGILTSDVIAALEDAVKFDVDSINISIGSDYASENITNNTLLTAVQACRNAGRTVVFAAGNSDRASYSAVMSDYSTGDNRSHPYSIKVGSIQSETAYMNYLTDDNGNKYPCVVKGRSTALSSLAVADCKGGTQAEIDAEDVTGKIALISMPDAYVSSGIYTYATRAMNAGAAAVVVGNTSNDLPDGNSGLAYSLFLVSRDTAEEIRENAETLEFTNQKTPIQRADAPRENMYSSYCNADNLDIAVDFSAPGGNIYSAYSGTTGYASLSGTSMAAPQVTGAVSLMYQYVEENFPEYTGAEKVSLVKNLLASTAEMVYYSDGIISSPRKVGSGIIKLDKAMETKIILKGRNSDETRINLGAELSESFEVLFTAYNSGSKDVTFDNINVEMSSDDYKYYESRGGYGYCGLKRLNATISGDESVTIPAESSVDIALDVTLSGEDIAYLEAALTNGFFIDGKVTLSGADNCDVGIPFSGFYGDWSKLPVMNQKRALDFCQIKGLASDGFAPAARILQSGSDIVLPISGNVDETISTLYAVMYANPVRNAFFTVSFDGEAVMKNAFYNKQKDLAYYMGRKTLSELSSVSEITIEMRLPYYSENEKNHYLTIKLVEDNEFPVVSDVYASDDEQTAYLVVSDNYGVSTISTYGMAGEEWEVRDVYINKVSTTAEIDISGLESLNYHVYDSAFNMTSVEPHIGIEVSEGKAIFTNNTHRHLPGAVCWLYMMAKN